MPRLRIRASYVLVFGIGHASNALYAVAGWILLQRGLRNARKDTT